MTANISWSLRAALYSGVYCEWPSYTVCTAGCVYQFVFDCAYELVGAAVTLLCKLPNLAVFELARLYVEAICLQATA